MGSREDEKLYRHSSTFYRKFNRGCRNINNCAEPCVHEEPRCQLDSTTTDVQPSASTSSSRDNNQGNPQQGYPQGGYPQGGYPQPGYPQGGYAQGDYPQPGYPEGGYAQGGFPQAGHPQAGYPQEGIPLGGYPQPGYPQPGYAYPPQPGFQPGYEDPSNTTVLMGDGAVDDKGFAFNDASIRRGFIRKVYAILMCQLSVTCAFIGLFSLEPSKLFVQKHLIFTLVLMGVSLVVLIVTGLAIACCGDVRRKAPMNYILLSFMTLAMSIILGLSTSLYDTYAVLMAVGITAALCLSLTVFAFQTKYDFTVMGAGLYVALVGVAIFGIGAIFAKRRIMDLIYASLTAILFSLYLVYDTQMMIGGNHKYSISPEEYVFAALSLYTDVIKIFTSILTMLKSER